MHVLPRRRLLALCVTVASGSLAGCGSSLDEQSTERTPEPSENATASSTDSSRTTAVESTESTTAPDDGLPITYSASRGSFSESDAPNSGWVHVVADGESADLTFDARLCTSRSVEVILADPPASDYTLEFETDGGAKPVTTTPSADAHRCGAGTHVVGGANLPSDWGELRVLVNGYEVRTVERSGTAPELRRLPDPIAF